MNDLGRIEDLPQAYRVALTQKQFGALVAKFAGASCHRKYPTGKPSPRIGPTETSNHCCCKLAS